MFTFIHMCCHTFNCVESYEFYSYICVITMTEQNQWHCSYHISKSFLSGTIEIGFLSHSLNPLKHMTNNMISSFKEICHRHTYIHKCRHVCICVCVCVGACFSNTIIHLVMNKVQYKPLICHKDKDEHWTESWLLKSYYTQYQVLPAGETTTHYSLQVITLSQTFLLPTYYTAYAHT